MNIISLSDEIRLDFKNLRLNIKDFFSALNTTKMVYFEGLLKEKNILDNLQNNLSAKHAHLELGRNSYYLAFCRNFQEENIGPGPKWVRRGPRFSKMNLIRAILVEITFNCHKFGQKRPFFADVNCKSQLGTNVKLCKMCVLRSHETMCVRFDRTWPIAIVPRYREALSFSWITFSDIFYIGFARPVHIMMPNIIGPSSQKAWNWY